jgi:hypothetical protein
MMDRPMQTAHDRYRNDITYRRVVDTMTHMLNMAEITPSEMREAAVLASINHESMNIRRYHIDLTPDLHRRLDEMHKLVSTAAEKARG